MRLGDPRLSYVLLLVIAVLLVVVVVMALGR
jgi:hypothetical protein